MFNLKNLPLTISLIVLISLIVGWGISMVLAWEPPTASPPDGNVAAPINVSGTAQTKSGDLNIGGSVVVTGSLTANTLSGTLNARNIASGIFGSEAGWGNYSFTTSGGSPVLYIDATNARIGIKDTTPSYELDVNGDANATRLCIAGDCRPSWPSGADGNNYTTGIAFTGTTTKTLTLSRSGMIDLTATFTDINTDTQDLSILGHTISLTNSPSVTVPDNYEPDTSAVTICSGTDVLTGAGACVANYDGYAADTNANTLCTGNWVFLDGEGNCRTERYAADTNANTICTGTSVYLDGDGNCDTVINTDTQDLSIVGHTISLTNSPSVTVPDNYEPDTNANTLCSGNWVFLDGGGVCRTDRYAANTDTQDLSIVGHTISLTNGGSVTVPDNYEPNTDASTKCSGDWVFLNGNNVCKTDRYAANTDTQNLSYAAATDIISLTNGGSIDITEVNTTVDGCTNCLNATEIEDIYVFSSGDTVTGNLYLNAKQIYGGFGAETTGGTLDWNHISNARSGNGYTLLYGNAANGPGPSSYFHPFSFEYSSKNGNGNMNQLAIPYSGTSVGPYYRTRYGGTWTGWVEFWTSGNDGSGSGLDADLLDGQHGSYYRDNTDTQDLSIVGHTISLTNGGSVTVPDNYEPDTNANTLCSGNWVFLDGGGVCRTDRYAANTDTQDLSIVGHTISLTNGGSVTVPDNYEPDTTCNGISCNISNTGTLDGYSVSTTRNAANTIPVRDGNGYLQLGWINTTSGNSGTNAPIRIYGSHSGDYIRYYTPTNFATVMEPYFDDHFWQAANDGSGSGLDADLLDGQNGSYYRDNTDTQDLSIVGHTISLTNGGSVTVPDNYEPNTDTQDLSIVGHTISLTNGGSVTVPDNYAPNTTCNGISCNVTNTGTLDGIEGASFLRSNANDTFTGKLSVGSTSTRQAGMYGIYDSYKVGHVWSMGTAYVIPANGSTFGNLYGMAYCHTNNAACKSGYGHQIDIVQNGTVGIALGMGGSAWFAGTVTAGNFECTTCIDEGDMAQNQIDDSEIQDNSLTAGSLAANSVGNSELVDDITVNYVRGINYIYGDYGTIARSTDEWLRLNDGSSHTNGVYIPNKLRADGGLYVSDDEYFWSDAEDRIATTDSFYVQSTSPATYLYSTHTYLGASSGDATHLRGNTINGNSWSITGAGKLTVVTIDPVYEIDGKEYATYVSDFAGGVRMETSGVIQLNSEAKYVIDFDNLEKGSDLWLFWETSNKEMNDLVVIPAPGFDGRVWYEKKGNKLVIYGDEPGEVSYRLTLPRLDDEDWGNLVEDHEN